LHPLLVFTHVCTHNLPLLQVIDISSTVITAAAPGITVTPLERFAFYEEARRGFVVVQCVAERRPYGNFILTKGVVGPDGKDLKP
jgi:L-fucose mutarotase/ribose pyranase (RbsD/FucU family)